MIDLSLVVGDPERIGKLMAEAVLLASSSGDVTSIGMDREGLHVEINPTEGLTLAVIERKRRALQARLEGLVR